MTDCIFCKLASGEIATNKVYEDDKTFAFLDMHPIRPGHVLVIPKTHVPDFYNIDDETYTALMTTVKKISKRLKEVFNPQKVGLMVAGWDVPHAHVHVVPMEDHQDITSRSTYLEENKIPSAEELANTAKLVIDL